MTTAALGIDTRMRARRIAVKRAQGRKRLKVLLCALSIVAVAGSVYGATHTPLLDIDRIAIAGTDAPTEISSVLEAELRLGMPMMYFDTDAVENAVAAIPKIESVRVRRDWPSTVRVDVVERTPVAVVPAPDGRSALIDANAYVIEWVPEVPVTANVARLPQLSVPFDGELGSIHTAADDPLAVVAAMPADLHRWVDAVTVDPGKGDLALQLVGGARAVIGPATALDDKMSSLRAVLGSTELACIIEIDVTMSDLAAVTRHPSCPI